MNHPAETVERDLLTWLGAVADPLGWNGHSTLLLAMELQARRLNPADLTLRQLAGVVRQVNDRINGRPHREPVSSRPASAGRAPSPAFPQAGASYSAPAAPAAASIP